MMLQYTPGAIFFYHGTTAPIGSRPPHCRGLPIPLKTHHTR